MNMFPRLTIFSLVCTALACSTDPGDVGSESATLSGSAEGQDSASADDGASEMDDDDGGSTGPSASASDSASDDATETGSPTEGDDSASASETNGSESGSPTSDDGEDSGSASESGESGTMVADCSECGPDEGCVAEVAFATEYFCVPIPEACGVEFTCDCASEFCVEPFTACYDLPDPPQRQIVCECPAC